MPDSIPTKTILLVEDEAIIAMTEAAMLTKNGYEVITAYNAEKAIENTKQDDIDLILMDIDLGEGKMDGTEAAEIILTELDIPLVFLSSHTEPEVVEKTEGITSYGYIVKNSGETVLLASIKMAFRLFEAKMQEKERRKELLHSRDVMRYVIEHNRSAVAIHDRELRYLYVSKLYLEQYNVREENIIGKHHYDVFPDLPRKWRDVHQRALAGEVLSAEDDPYERDDGSVDWTRWECRPWYESDGSIGGIIIYTEVITEKKRIENTLRKSEESYKKAQAIARLGGWEYDIETGSFWGSDEGKRIYGLNPEKDTFTTEEVMRCVIERERVDQAMIDLIERNIPYDIEFDILPCNSREKKTIHSIAELERDENGTPVKVIGTLHDITEQKKAEKEIAEQKEKLERKNIVLHELVEQIAMEKNGAIQSVYDQIASMVMPIINEMEAAGVGTSYVQRLKFSLNSLSAAPAPDRINVSVLSHREAEICNLIKGGARNKEIAALLNISETTVAKHRMRIRKKLNIVNTSTNLETYLQSGG